MTDPNGAAMYGVPWIPSRKHHILLAFFYHIYIYTYIHTYIHTWVLWGRTEIVQTPSCSGQVFDISVARNATDRTETQYRHGARGHGSLSLPSFGLGFPT